jgi:hypothetical protein
VVADVHTDAPDDTVGDPGCVLHEGVGNVHILCAHNFDYLNICKMTFES